MNTITTMQTITSPKIPTPNGHYSPAIVHNGLLYISGQLPVDPEDKSIPDTIEAQTDLVLAKLEQILTAAGRSKTDVIQVRIYVSNVSMWGRVNERYADFFGAHKPVRCVVPTGPLHYGCLIELEAVAAAE
jgi:reactive intermediate/imine deaminase